MNGFDEFDFFFRNTGSALEIIGSLSSSYFHRFPELESFVMATGVRCADENWAWINSKNYSRELLIEVIKFFEDRSLQFIWPVFPGSGVQMGLDMDELGLLTRENFSAMTFDAVADSYVIELADIELDVKSVLTSEDAMLWADTNWKGFTERGETPPEFVRFARYAALNNKLRLFFGYVENEPAGTCMLCKCEGIVISHFSVLPKWRNMGVGSALMNEIMAYNNSVKNRFLVLIATKQGKKLYKKYGFRNIADISIRSFSDSV